jgi:hypothetical protein
VRLPLFVRLHAVVLGRDQALLALQLMDAIEAGLAVVVWPEGERALVL